VWQARQLMRDIAALSANAERQRRGSGQLLPPAEPMS
jgi:hypothetical protein